MQREQMIRSSVTGLHSRFHPDCPIGWHELHDHPTAAGTRAGLRWAISDGYQLGGTQ